jgi:hypothetical protein
MKFPKFANVYFSQSDLWICPDTYCIDHSNGPACPVTRLPRTSTRVAIGRAVLGAVAISQMGVALDQFQNEHERACAELGVVKVDELSRKYGLLLVTASEIGKHRIQSMQQAAKRGYVAFVGDFDRTVDDSPESVGEAINEAVGNYTWKLFLEGRSHT